jgi:hypothetical protein
MGQAPTDIIFDCQDECHKNSPLDFPPGMSKVGT